MAEREIEAMAAQPFLCGCLAQRQRGTATTTGWRAGIIWAANRDEALGRFVRERSEAEPDFQFSVPSAEAVSRETRGQIFEMEAALRKATP